MRDLITRLVLAGIVLLLCYVLATAIATWGTGPSAPVKTPRPSSKSANR